MATGELGMEQNLSFRVEPRQALSGDRRMEERKTKVAERRMREGDEALKRWEVMVGMGVEKLAMGAIERQVQPEVEEVMGTMRWLAVNAPDRFKGWMNELGLDDREIAVVQGVVEAMGDRDRLSDAAWELKEAMRGDLGTLEGGEALSKLLSAVRLSNQSTDNSEQEWGDVYDEGEGRTAAGGAPLNEPPKEGKDKGKLAIDKKTRTIVLRRKLLMTLLMVGMIGICGRLGLLQLAARGWGEATGVLTKEGAEEVAVEKRFIPVMGEKLAAEALVERMFWEEVEEDPEHRVIEVFLRTYGTATPDVRAARGESMLEELGRQGLLQEEGGVVSIDEEGLRDRLIGEGYAEEEVDKLIDWSRQYLLDRGELLATLPGD